MIRILILLLITASTACSGPDKNADTKEIVRTNGTVAQETFVLANQQLDNGEYKEAAKLYRKALKSDPDRWDIHMNLAIALSRDAKFNDALGAIEVAFQKGGDQHDVTYFNLGNIFTERGMYPQAIDAYRAALSKQSSPDVDTLINLAAAYLFIFKYDEARATYDHVSQLFPDDPRASHGIGLVYQTQSLYPEALDFYEKTHRIDSNFSMAYFNKAWVLAAMDRHDEAIQSMETYLSRDPNGPYVNRARNLIGSWKRKISSKS